MQSYPHGFSLLLVALGLAVLSGCSLIGDDDGPSDPERPSIDFTRFSQAPPLVVGRWEWEKSVLAGFGDGPTVRTPATTGRTETLVFPTPDSVRVYQNDTLARRTTREAVTGINWGVRNDTLATSDLPLDGPLVIYERVE